jgi:flagellar biosynthetic protein FliQ
MVMAPILFTGLVVGVSVAVLQAATQVNEPTLTFIPKIIAVGMVSGAVLPWGLDRLVQMVTMVIGHISDIP